MPYRETNIHALNKAIIKLYLFICIVFKPRYPIQSAFFKSLSPVCYDTDIRMELKTSFLIKWNTYAWKKRKAYITH